MSLRSRRILQHVNGHPIGGWAPASAVGAALSSPTRDRPTCPKRCDVAIPPEHGGGDQYVCVCCGTQFTWKAPP